MSDHYCCKKCNLRYEDCSCVSGFERKSAGQELKEASDLLDKHKQQIEQEKSAIYWLSVRAQAQKLCSQAIENCRIAVKNYERHIQFGEISDENVARKLAEYLEEEEFQVELKYNESTPFYPEKESYWWVKISW